MCFKGRGLLLCVVRVRDTYCVSATRLLDCSTPDKCAVCRFSKWNVVLTV